MKTTISNPRPGIRPASCLALLLAGGWSLSATAQTQQTVQLLEDNAVTFYANSTTTYDDNIFRLSDEVDPEDYVGDDQRSDLIQTGLLGVHIDKPYAQQRIVGDLSYARYWYQNHDFLDASATNYNLAWRWKFTPRIGGSITGIRREAPSDFDYYQNYARRNVYTIQDYRLRLDANPFGGWHLLGGASTFSVANSSQTADTPKFNSTFGEAGLAYDTVAGTRFQFVGKFGTGEYGRSNTDQFADARDFDENGFEFFFSSQPASLLTTKLTLGWVERTHPDAAQRDYDGMTADGTIKWLLTEKFNLSLKGRRLINSFQDANFSYYTREELSLVPEWNPSDRVTVSASVGYVGSDFGGTPDTSSGVERDESTVAYSADITWTPALFLQIKGSAGSRTRSSNYTLQDLDYTASNVSLSISLFY